MQSEGREKKRAGERGRSKRKGIMLQGRVERGGQRERGRKGEELNARDGRKYGRGKGG